ncbi:hypothetical protein LTR16_009912, partial [Cryomyces antarcticus]
RWPSRSGAPTTARSLRPVLPRHPRPLHHREQLPEHLQRGADRAGARPLDAAHPAFPVDFCRHLRLHRHRHPGILAFRARAAELPRLHRLLAGHLRGHRADGSLRLQARLRRLSPRALRPAGQAAPGHRRHRRLLRWYRRHGGRHEPSLVRRRRGAEGGRGAFWGRRRVRVGLRVCGRVVFGLQDVGAQDLSQI